MNYWIVGHSGLNHCQWCLTLVCSILNFYRSYSFYYHTHYNHNESFKEHSKIDFVTILYGFFQVI